ncbi:MAG TPA: SdrD B-like domain-containing protein, partial [Pirellulales bacterium]|nr:SdrD B-like domain-containing protein [Pirellulales bacterium]
MERRSVMTAAVHVGAVYYDPASGLDTTPSTIQISFAGGAAGTQLTHLVIDGSKDGEALTFNDAIFDTAAGGLGAYGFSPLKIVAHDGFEVTGSSVIDGGTQLALDFQGFEAGMKLVLSIDVDQVLFVDPQPGDVEVDAVDEGAEFQRAHLSADFTAPHYENLTASTQFWDAFDSQFAAADAESQTTLSLPDDRYTDPTQDQSVLTAGAVAVARQIPQPDSISGVVFADGNINGQQDSGEPGIGGVSLALDQWNGTAYVPTDQTATTAADGSYRFANLLPGKYQVRETEPDGYWSVGATPGTVAGQTRGIATSGDEISDIELLGGDDSVRNDFAEAQFNSISGHVGLAVEGLCGTPNTPPIAGVVIHLLDAEGNSIATATTDANGNYSFDHLTGGTYGIHEDQPTGYFDADTHAGSAGGTVSGDSISQILMRSDTSGTDYDFCELLPASISGYVYSDLNNNGRRDAGESGIAGVTLALVDNQGHATGTTTTTDANGFYQFTGLRPGTYGVSETQPVAYLDGLASAGSAGGQARSGELITGAALTSGLDASDYDFGELVPNSIGGHVGVAVEGECGTSLTPPISGVVIHLLDAQGNSIATTTTDVDGNYTFDNLPPGSYGILEDQPAGYFDADTHAGSAGGAVTGNMITGIAIVSGNHATDYDFCELLPAKLGGYVFRDLNNNGQQDPGESGIAGATLTLTDASGQPIGIVTTTDANGYYSFAGLRPGTYGVRETQPAGYFDGLDTAGSAGGAALDPGDSISGAVLLSGTDGERYNFGELPPVSISGIVFQDGPPIAVTAANPVPNVPAVRDGKLTPDDTLLAGVTLELVDGMTGEPILGSQALPGAYPPGAPITVVTDAQGHYEFSNLAPGTYGVVEVVPRSYTPGMETAGSVGGTVIGKWAATNPAVINQLKVSPLGEAIVGIGLASGDTSTSNNFSVVATAGPNVQVFVFPQAPVFPAAGALPPGLNPNLQSSFVPTSSTPLLLAPTTRVTGAPMYTWHLSVIDAGQPRLATSADEPATSLTALRDDFTSNDTDLSAGEWILGNAKGKGKRFGLRGAIPISGDFNGDGKSDLGLFKDGQWFIDLNDNGHWDRGDLWARLGRKGDQPVTGDWDGDGKADIGIYGPAWPRDPHAVRHEPGLPEARNQKTGIPKNIVRPPQQNAAGERMLRLVATGKPRADAIDHVFFYGTPGDHPVVGDWDGDGIHTIAVFRNGRWHRDTDGDGKPSTRDAHDHFGQVGDLPIVGDFNGDGVD